MEGAAACLCNRGELDCCRHIWCVFTEMEATASGFYLVGRCGVCFVCQQNVGESSSIALSIVQISGVGAADLRQEGEGSH